MDARLAAASEYAAQVRARNKPPCDCETCIQAALLPAVIQITERWPMPAAAKSKVRRIR